MFDKLQSKKLNFSRNLFEDSMKRVKNGKKRTNLFLLWVFIGIAIGSGVGYLIKDYGVGLCIGLATGVALGVIIKV